jgi:hypothetical protein
MLEEKFGIPVFINNDGDLFVYGEAIGGLLPHVNGLLEKAGSPKRYQLLSPPSGPTQWLFQGPPAQSKFLGASLSPERRGWRS